jgi:predicted dehydrogenase/threonine dehydrogenase-like Zn-dependent dehydrogenase
MQESRELVMKQVTQNYRSGEIKLESLDTPAVKPGGVLVKTRFSVISTGTEGMKVKEAKLGYLGKARARPEQVRKVMQAVQQQGVVTTYRKVMNRLDSLTPLGYSASGVVAAVGAGAEEFRVGQNVACAGAGYANHAEVNFVPKNLVVPVPDGVRLEHASFATIGAIAMQGFRQAELQLGETACVIGLGLLGQLLVQILCTAGIRVIGIDLMKDRCARAEESGALVAVTPNNLSLKRTASRITHGLGVDCAFISAGGNSNAPVQLAIDIVRDRGRIVDIGKTRLELPWQDCYMKELDVRFSRSYGPGRYDPNYEEKGIDYPAGYVRWTERRNMSAFLDLVASGNLSLDRIMDRIVPFDDAEQTYRELASGSAPGLGVVFRYGAGADIPAPVGYRVSPTTGRASPVDGALGVGVIGAGNYASSMLLPHLLQHHSVALREVATATGLSTANAMRKFKFERTSTDYQELLSAEDVEAVIIATRHDSHASMTVDALRRGKAVFVEKPLAIDVEGLEAVRKAVVESDNDRLMVGFNRRFSPMLTEARRIVRPGTALVVHYRVHTGQIEPGAWYLDASTQGSRFVGEAGHFLDVLSHLIDSRPISVTAHCLRPDSSTQDDLENVSVTVEYENGSLGSLLYVTQGASKVPKEYMEVFGGGTTIQLNNFENMILFHGTDTKRVRKGSGDKGQKAQIDQFVSAVRTGGQMPISLESLLDTTLVTLAASDSMRTGETVYLSNYFGYAN